MIILGDCVEEMEKLPDRSVDAVITDPPYPFVDRPYGRLNEEEWSTLMDKVIAQARRVLVPSGSAVFVLQPNSEHVGSVRPWFFRFLSKYSSEWNMVQDAWWWNPAALPNVQTQRRFGLMRPSVKVCAWFGPLDCYRRQEEVLWTPSQANQAVDREDRALRRHPSGYTARAGRQAAASDERGGTTPFNLIPISNTNSSNSGGARGHGASTPEPLCSWWVRYVCPPGGVVLDPFFGSGTVGVACRKSSRKFIGIEMRPEYVSMAEERIARCGAS